MTTFLLIRHGAHDWLDRGIAGRLQGVHLNARGRQEAQALAAHLRPLPIEALYSSPLARTWETAEILSHEWGLPRIYNAAFLEIDFGAWTGRDFDVLRDDPEWLEWNHHRATARAPGGESMDEVTSRAVDELRQLAGRHHGGLVAIISHADVIRALLLYCLSRSLDDIHQFQIDPASVTVIEWDQNQGHPTLTNYSGGEGPLPLRNFDPEFAARSAR